MARQDIRLISEGKRQQTYEININHWSQGNIMLPYRLISWHIVRCSSLHCRVFPFRKQNRKFFPIFYLERGQPAVCLLRIAGTGTAQGRTEARGLRPNAGESILPGDHHHRLVTLVGLQLSLYNTLNCELCISLSQLYVSYKYCKCTGQRNLQTKFH